VQARRKYLDFTDEEKALLEGILNQYRSAVQIKRIHLKPILADFDITKNQHVTKHQFLRTLDVLGVTAPSTTLNVLLKAYMDKGNADEVNYYDFCEDIDGSEQLFYVSRGFNHSFDYYPKTRAKPTGFDVSKATPDDIDDVLARLRRDCMEQRIRIGEFFRDFDKLRKGYITEAQFRIGLNMSKLVLSGSEFRLLTEQFHADVTGGSFIRWREFCDAVDEVFTKKGLEKDHTIVLGDARTSSVYGQAKPTEADLKVVENYKAKFSSMVQRERLNARSFF